MFLPPDTAKTGKRDRSGAGWRFLENEFRSQIKRIVATGRGLHFTAHSKEAQIETRSGQEFVKIVPRFTGQCDRIIVPLVDHVFFIDYFRLKAGGVARVLITKGDDLIVAGHKKGTMPRYLLLPEDEPERDYEVVSAAFKGDKSNALDATQIMVSASTSEAGAEALGKEKRAKARESAKGGGS